MAQGISSVEVIAAAIRALAATEPSTLFAGAGVGMHAGLPDWKSYAGILATAAEQYDSDTAELMRKRLAGGYLLKVFDLFRACTMPESTRLQAMAAPFSHAQYQAKNLRSLVRLPFNSIVTTNFDRSLHDAFAMVHQRAPFMAELHDPTLKQALYHWKDSYIARIHGRAELPKTLVVDETGYQRAAADSDYVEFLVYILLRTRCLFVGYSFVDPAIHTLLKIADERVASSFPLEHLALLPASGLDLVERLSRYNIRVLLYDEADHHVALWQAIRQALNEYKAGDPKPEPTPRTPLLEAHQLLAAAYARAKMSGVAAPLRHLVCEGVLLGLLTEQGPQTRLEASERFRRVVPLSASEAAQIVHPAVDHLIREGVVEERERLLYVLRPPEDKISPDLDLLAQGAVDRVRVRFGVEAPAEVRAAIRRIIEHLVLSRGWDLAASLASAKRSDVFDLAKAMSKAIEHFAGDISPKHRDLIGEALRDLLERPERSEAPILTRLARLSFGVEVALERGRSTLVHSLTLPERIYLDASVLLPAITTGHPYRAAYVSAIRRLQEAASRAGTGSKVLVLESFLNEIISHRARAIHLVAEGGLEDPARLARFIGFTRADYTNVYVGGFSSAVGRSARRLTFQQYLAEAAPYSTETEAAAYLSSHGIETVSAKPGDPKERDYVARINTELYAGYAAASSQWREKPPILIAHEAAQLARLMRELERGERSVFVTADNQLRRLARGELLGPIASALFSHTGLLQLVDLLLGLDADDESLSRLLWAVEARTGTDALRGYFIDLALRRYDAALAMSMPALVERFVSEASAEASRDRVALAFRDANDDLARTFDFLDRFADRFYEGMAQEIRRREATA